MKKTNTIDDFFKPTSKEVAKNIIGMNIESKNGIYVVSATKPYYRESKQTKDKPKLHYGGIMMFNIRGHPHFCVATGEGHDQDYFLISRVQDKGEEIKSAKGVSNALGLSFYDEGRKFADLFRLSGITKPSTFKKYDNDAATCLGVYEIIK